MKVSRPDRTPRLDVQTRQLRVNEQRRRFGAMTNKSLSHHLGTMARLPRSKTSEEREALLVVAADRLWKWGDHLGEG